MKASDPQSPFFPHKDELHTYQTVENKILQNGLKIIELLPKVSDFMSLDGNELDKARLVKIVLSSPILKHRTIEFSYEKPFDVLLVNVREKNWWTNPSNKQRPQPHVIIELPFLARVHSRERISDLYVNGNSLREIERQLNIPKTTARGVLIASGIEMRTSLNHQSKNVPQPLGMRSGTIPFGFTYLNGKLVIEPSEYKVVLEIVRRHQKDESFRSIARHLNNKKVTTRLGKKWTHEIVKRVIERQQKTKRRKS